MLSRPDMLTGICSNPLLAAASSLRADREATITSLPSFLNSSASASPMPEPPPVISMVLPVSFIVGLLPAYLARCACRQHDRLDLDPLGCLSLSRLATP